MDASVVEGFGDWFEVVVGLGSLAVLALLAIRILRVWRRYHWTQRCVFAALVFYNLGTVWRIIEILQNDYSFSFGYAFTLVANSLMVVYLWEPRDRWDKRVDQDLRHPPERTD